MTAVDGATPTDPRRARWYNTHALIPRGTIHPVIEVAECSECGCLLLPRLDAQEQHDEWHTRAARPADPAKET